MTEKIENGDYVYENGMLQTLEHTKAVLQSLQILLQCPRGKYYPNKNFGSHIPEMKIQAPNDLVLAYARQAVSEIDGVFIKSVEIDNGQAVFDVLVNNEEGKVYIKT